MKYFIIFFTAFSFCFCRDQKQSTIIADSKSVNLDTVKKEIPMNKHGEYSYFYQDICKLSKAMNLPIIENGFDSLQIRVWYPETIPSKVIVFSFASQKWNGTMYTFRNEYDHITGKDTITQFKKSILKPQSSWNEFSQNILDFGITSLPNSESILGYSNGGTDGENYCIEIATSIKYRFYIYDNPDENMNFQEVRQFEQILRLIADEFGFDH